MEIFRCKMCGGNLEVAEGMKICICDYCGSGQPVPQVENAKKTGLFNRANTLRMECEFDRAAAIYDSIVAEFPNEAEAYWGLCLCEYGIEYVDDKKTSKKIPTCHRTSYTCIYECSNYKNAVSYSDPEAAELYREQAKAIDAIQKKIINVAKNEKPFDIFICYKESDERGERTLDSVMAQDIYERLTRKGYKVFFSRITLEDKLGQEYEPYIFAALNSAKIMLVVGTKAEHFQAIWVKNEWNRFLSVMEKDDDKMLIPCYRDISPYDMPEEFHALQGQDMSKISFMQDLLYGIDKILGKNKPVNQSSSTPATELKSCPHCGSMISTGCSACPQCGKPVSFTSRNNSNYNNYNSGVQQHSLSNPNVQGNYVDRTSHDPNIKNKYISLALCIVLGFLGLHKFYEGKKVMGVLYFFTMGLFGLGVIIDFIRLLFKPKNYHV